MSKENYINTDQIKSFVKTSHDYYIHEFEKINNNSKFVLSFNLFAFLFGSIWFGIRNIWNWALAFLIIETFAIVQIVRGFFGNISAEAYIKIDKIQSTIDFREKQLQAAIEKNPWLKKELQDAADQAMMAAQTAAQTTQAVTAGGGKAPLEKLQMIGDVLKQRVEYAAEAANEAVKYLPFP